MQDKSLFGYAGQVLRVNLTAGNIKIKELDEELARDYLGGNGFCARLLYNMTGTETDPLGPENVLIFDEIFPATAFTAYGAFWETLAFWWLLDMAGLTGTPSEIDDRRDKTSKIKEKKKSVEEKLERK